MKRRKFIAGLASAAVWPVVARAQQQAALPVVGFLNQGAPPARPDQFITAVRRGLSETGYIEGRNLSVEYRWAEDRLDRLPAWRLIWFAVGPPLSVTGGTPAAFAAKEATKSIPIVFAVGSDPVQVGLVASLSRPGGNLTGISVLLAAVAAKRLELLHELVPAATSIAYLVNPTNHGFAETEAKEMQVAAHTLGVQLLILSASDQSQFEATVATVARERAGGLVVGGDLLFITGADTLVALTDRLHVPAIYPTVRLQWSADL